jgi:type IV secretion system protein VirD4
VKLKDNQIIIRILLFLGGGAMFNVLLLGYISLLMAHLQAYKIEGLSILFNLLTQEPLIAVMEIVLGSGSTPVIQSGHELYLNVKLQGVYWLLYVFNAYKILFTKSKRFRKIDASKHGTHGSARWASPKEIKQRFLQTDKGMIVGAFKGKPCIQAIDGENNHMTLVYGGSGSGKTSGYSIPNILHISETLGESFVITDPKGDTYNATVPRLKELGYNVYRINLLDFRKSHRYNPLDYVTNGPEALSLVNTLMKNTGEDRKSDFWEKAERSLYAALILYLKETRPKEEQHFLSVLRLGLQIGKNPDLLNQIFEQLPDDSEAKTFYDIFNNAEDKTRSGILVGFGVRLQLWAIKDIRNLTAKNDFDIRELGRKKTAVFILTRDEESTFDLITAMFIDQTFQELVKEARIKPNQCLGVPVRMILDEIANIAPINDLQKRMAVMRSRGVRVSLIFQGIQQFKNRYGDGIAAEISDSCDNQIVLQANDNSTAVPVSEMLGKTTILTNSVSQNHNERGSSSGMNYSMQGRELMTAQEIRNKDKRKLILFQKGEDPAFIDKYFYYEQKRWKNIQQTSWNDEPNRIDEPLSIFSPSIPSAPFIAEQEWKEEQTYYEEHHKEQEAHNETEKPQDKKPFDLFA